MSVTLSPLTAADQKKVAHLAVRPEQLRFSGTVAESFADDAHADFHAILQGDLPVGMFRIDRGYHAVHGFAEPTDLGLRTVIVDAAYQGQGLGTAAMRALPRYLQTHYPQARRLWLTVNLQNPAAIASYRKSGFQDTGAIWPHGGAGPQHIMRLMLTR
ncbi:MAG: GNAT family N-acetyltransferase [Rhodobacterales bacterium]